MTYTNKTQPTGISPKQYLEANYKGKERIQKEATILIDFYTDATDTPCVMWNKIFGFGTYYYFDSKGGEHAFMMTGFAISSTGFTLYNVMGWETYINEMEGLGTYKLSGKSCMAIKSVENIDLTILKKVIAQSLKDIKKKYRTE